MPDITAVDGQIITAKAVLWRGTPYALVGDLSIKGAKGDCSGTTSKIYAEAGLPYEYRSVESFPTSNPGRFHKIAAGGPKQDGDILLWGTSHMAIYSTFKTAGESAYATTERVNKSGSKWTQYNDMWTASHPGGPDYGPGASKYWFDGQAPDVYRYIKGDIAK